MSIEEQLLTEYKKYDYLNTKQNEKLVKILVGYIKPSFLFKSEILTPIHLGRTVEKEKSKDGIVTGSDLKWLHENCIGDDDFEGNISSVNRRVGFLTGTYWAWKNYEKIGNPKYFGSYGYRRLFSPFILESLEKYDAVLPNVSWTPNTVKDQFIYYHGTTLYDTMLKVFSVVHPKDLYLFERYLNSCNSYFFEIYILKRNLFFEFCEWIFPLLFSFLTLPQVDFELTEMERKNILRHYAVSRVAISQIVFFEEYMKRDIAFIIERLTGFYLYKLRLNDKLKVSHQLVLQTNPNDEQESFGELHNTINYLKKHIDYLNENYVVPNLSECSEQITFISVVKDYNLYKKYVLQNKFIISLKNSNLISYDNRDENIPIPKRYNDFIKSYDYSTPSWFIFCHSDWEIIDDINKKIPNLDKSVIYGIAGVRLIKKGTKIGPLLLGEYYEQSRDGKKFKVVSELTGKDTEVDSIDCQVIMCHSSLINKYKLKFDENLSWDLYAEDFSISAYTKFKIKTKVISLKGIHHSDAGFKNLPLSYANALTYLNKKYSKDIFGGCCSLIGGGSYDYLSMKEFIFSKIRLTK